MILGSTSPYKRALFEQLEIPFAIVDPVIDETAFYQTTVAETVRVVAEAKAQALLPRYAGTDTIIVTADVAGELDGTFLGKPTSREDAIATIMSYSGQEMYVWTGTTVTLAKTGVMKTDVRKATIQFKPLLRAQVEQYVDEKQPLDKGGSIAIEEIEERGFVTSVHGERAAIIGLSLEFVRNMLY